MKKIIIPLVLFALSFNTKAQNGIENILFADISDANKLTLEYTRPAAEGFIFGMSNGWYHTAKVHKTLGFDITIGANISSTPSSREMFDVNALGLSNKITQNPNTSPTVLASENADYNAFQVTIPANSDPTINGGNHPELTRKFTMPDGLGDDLPLNGIPTPTVQVSVGLPSNFEATVRFIPEIGDDTSGQLFGLGVKKEITNWFGPVDKTPLHISLMAAYTNMSITSTIDDPSGNEINITNGVSELDLNSYTVQALASLNLPFVSIYGGLGFIKGSSSLNLRGNYELQYENSISSFSKELNDPFNLDYDVSGFTSTIGARFSLGFFKIYGSYSLQEYNTFSAGIAVSVR